ncbi:MAG: hypothetical protein MRERC_1c147 [Mycoplasmataceae bacterium RC_NB112A]|nr:MAG: hypothetical protein MRERC_1c147 [Mycoplasmataceae bacterium RC_NB112A]
MQAWKKVDASLIVNLLQEKLKEVKKEFKLEREEFKKF